jgi:hypothetical protein
MISPDTKSPDSTPDMVNVGPLAARELLKLLPCQDRAIPRYHLTASGRSFIWQIAPTPKVNPIHQQSELILWILGIIDPMGLDIFAR